MSVITTMPAVEVDHGATGAQDGPSCRSMRPQLTPEVQKIFDRAFGKKEGKLRRELEMMRRDLLETTALTGQLLDRCRDRISLEDQRAIRSGLEAIRSEYSREAKCQTAH
jgi:hypothetical protein